MLDHLGFSYQALKVQEMGVLDSGFVGSGMGLGFRILVVWGSGFRLLQADCWHVLPIGPKVVPFWGSYNMEFYKVIPKRNYFGAYG